jgi:uridine kinase
MPGFDIDSLVLKYVRKEELTIEEIAALEVWIAEDPERDKLLTRMKEDPEWVEQELQRISEVEPDRIWGNVELRLKNDGYWYDGQHAIPTMISESDKGPDQLGFTNDVNALAKIIATTELTPPLAIAIFGKWGSGKSFFISKLKARISELSLSTDNKTFCKGIVHIHFNAWSYMDSDLWASLVSKIFESLNEYISANSKTDLAKKEIEDHLLRHLAISKEQIVALGGHKVEITERITELQMQRTVIRKEVSKKISEIGNHTLAATIDTVNKEFKVKQRILRTLNENPTFRITVSDLEKIVPPQYWDSPAALLQQVRSGYTFLRQFFRKGNMLKLFIFLTASLSLIFFIPISLDLIIARLKSVNFLIPQVVLSLLGSIAIIYRRAEKVYERLQPVIASFWSIKVDYEEEIKKATSKFEQAEKALIMKINSDTSQLKLLDAQIQKTISQKIELEYRIRNTLLTEALYSFIDRRSKSDDYKKRLGIISIIRQDFETLTGLFLGHNKEAVDTNASMEFREKFKQPLERIVLYIDDLDRCSEENVVQVLEAVNLLMAYPLFVAVVGVDPRWIRNALLKKHAAQFLNLTNAADQPSPNSERINCSQYLEKIFQIPFHLKGPTAEGLKNMIRNLSITVSTPDTDSTPPGNHFNTSTGEISTNIGEVAPDLRSPNPVSDSPYLLVLNNKEIAAMERLSVMIDANPRTANRFINTFRIVKAHEDLDLQGSKKDPSNLLCAALFLIAIGLGAYKHLLPSFEAFIQDPANARLHLKTYFKRHHDTAKFTELDQLNSTLAEDPVLKPILNMSLGLFNRQNQLIRRFRFNE